MSKLKKFAAGALAAAICTVSFAAQTPATADAATYCSHNIYKAGRVEVGSSTDSHEVERVLKIGFIEIPYTVTCETTTTTYRDVYACYKCSYGYSGGTYSVTTHSHSH